MGQCGCESGDDDGSDDDIDDDGCSPGPWAEGRTEDAGGPLFQVFWSKLFVTDGVTKLWPFLCDWTFKLFACVQMLN